MPYLASATLLTRKYITVMLTESLVNTFKIIFETSIVIVRKSTFTIVSDFEKLYIIFINCISKYKNSFYLCMGQ